MLREESFKTNLELHVLLRLLLLAAMKPSLPAKNNTDKKQASVSRLCVLYGRAVLDFVTDDIFLR